MKFPSKRAYAQSIAEAKRQRAFLTNDHALFAEAVNELAAIDGHPDVYTCIQCGDDFEHGPHVDLLVVKVLEFGDDGSVTGEFDYAPIRDPKQNGRRFKVCQKCFRLWAHHPAVYSEMR